MNSRWRRAQERVQNPDGAQKPAGAEMRPVLDPDTLFLEFETNRKKMLEPAMTDV